MWWYSFWLALACVVEQPRRRRWSVLAPSRPRIKRAPGLRAGLVRAHDFHVVADVIYGVCIFIYFLFPLLFLSPTPLAHIIRGWDFSEGASVPVSRSFVNNSERKICLACPRELGVNFGGHSCVAQRGSHFPSLVYEKAVLGRGGSIGTKLLESQPQDAFFLPYA